VFEFTGVTGVKLLKFSLQTKLVVKLVQWFKNWDSKPVRKIGEWSNFIVSKE